MDIQGKTTRKENPGWLSDLVALFFPRLCLSCGDPLSNGEEMLCSICHFHLPRTHFHFDAANPLARVFWGRVRLESAVAFCYFHKGGSVQHLLHQLKYSGNRELGIYFGRIYGNELKFTSFFEDIDCLVPVPLHPRKIRKRGYNQSEVFAQGLAGPAALEIISNCLYRKVHSSTQTRKGRYNRWENVGEIFGVRDEDKLINKHILLVDDVVTTGATLEACAQVLVSIPGVRVSVAAIAYAA
jgi:ComF family protein